METGLISEPLIQNVLNSNLRKDYRRICLIVPFRFLIIGLYAAEKLFCWDSHQFKFLWFNFNVKCKRRALYIKEFASAGICYHYQLMDDNYYFLSFSALAQKYLKNQNKLFLKYVKLHLSIPENWNGNIPSSHFQRNPNNFLEMSNKIALISGDRQKSIFISRNTSTSVDKRPFT